jgi:hypothetical protein
VTTAGGDSAPRQTWVQWLAHHVVAITLLYAASVPVTWMRLPLVLSIAGALPLALWMVTLAWATPVHGRSLCERCASEAPLNPGMEAERCDRRLRQMHWIGDMPPFVVLTAGFLVIVAVNVAGAVLRLGAPTTLALIGIGLYVNVITRTHNRLQPWCPYCRRGRGDGDPAVTPTPDPAGVVKR